jgi:hypothetical protein
VGQLLSTGVGHLQRLVEQSEHLQRLVEQSEHLQQLAVVSMEFPQLELAVVSMEFPQLGLAEFQSLSHSLPPHTFHNQPFCGTGMVL